MPCFMSMDANGEGKPIDETRLSHLLAMGIECRGVAPEAASIGHAAGEASRVLTATYGGKQYSHAWKTHTVHTGYGQK